MRGELHTIVCNLETKTSSNGRAQCRRCIKGLIQVSILSTLFQTSYACFELWPLRVADFLALQTLYGNENKVLARKTCQNVPKKWAVKNIFKQISWTLSCYSVPAQKHIVSMMIYIFTEIFPYCSFHFWSILHFINKNIGGKILNIMFWKKYSEYINMNP